MESYKLSLIAKEDLRRIYTFGFVEFGELQAESISKVFFRHLKKLRVIHPHTNQLTIFERGIDAAHMAQTVFTIDTLVLKLR
tara:strand:- start:75 stop:320 length:246 start_codon:yes stop_codon:yes gene_type:complete